MAIEREPLLLKWYGDWPAAMRPISNLSFYSQLDCSVDEALTVIGLQRTPRYGSCFKSVIMKVSCLVGWRLSLLGWS